jgi:hypothetical protein
MKARTQPLYDRHAQLLLAPQDFANAAWRSQRLRPREPMLFHEIPDQFRRARLSARPLNSFLGSDQTCLRAEPSDILLVS